MNVRQGLQLVQEETEPAEVRLPGPEVTPGSGLLHAHGPAPRLGAAPPGRPGLCPVTSLQHV